MIQTIHLTEKTIGIINVILYLYKESLFLSFSRKTQRRLRALQFPFCGPKSHSDKLAVAIAALQAIQFSCGSIPGFLCCCRLGFAEYRVARYAGRRRGGRKERRYLCQFFIALQPERAEWKQYVTQQGKQPRSKTGEEEGSYANFLQVARPVWYLTLILTPPPCQRPPADVMILNEQPPFLPFSPKTRARLPPCVS